MSLRNTVSFLASLAVLTPALGFGNDASSPYTHVGVPGVDSDGDGVDDNMDAEPCYNWISARQFMPADRSWGLLLFEDNWPSEGDFDFNDAVVAYNYDLGFNSAGRITEVTARFRIMAVGALNENGLALRLPGTNQSNVQFVGMLIGDQWRENVAMRSNETEVVVDMTRDLHTLFGTQDTREFVNTDPNLPRRNYVQLKVLVQFRTPTTLRAQNSPFDVFIFDRNRGTEVHLPMHGGTASLDTSLFGTASDGSTVGTRHFVNQRNIPFALHIPEIALYPRERVAIDNLFPAIGRFGQSLGTQATDFYRSPETGYAFGSINPGPFPYYGWVNTGCFAPDPGVCGPSATVGSVGAPTSGLCDNGSPSSVTTAAGFHTWTCQGTYSQATSCDTPAWACVPNTTSVCAVANGTGIQTCNGSGTASSACTVTACNAGYYAQGNTCQPQVCTPGTSQSCPIANGTGTQTCDAIGSSYYACQVSTCNSGYVRSGNTCIPDPNRATVGRTDTIRRSGFSWRCNRWNGRMCIENYLGVPTSAVVTANPCETLDTEAMRPVWHGPGQECSTICWVATGNASVRTQQHAAGRTATLAGWLYQYGSTASCDASGRRYSVVRNPGTGMNQAWSFDSRSWVRTGYFIGCDCAGW